MAVGPLMLYTLAAVSPLVIEDLEMSDAQYGAVSAVTFISAAGGAFFLGGQSARFTARHVMMGIAIGSGVSLGLLAAATNSGRGARRAAGSSVDGNEIRADRLGGGQ